MRLLGELRDVIAKAIVVHALLNSEALRRFCYEVLEVSRVG